MLQVTMLRTEQRTRYSSRHHARLTLPIMHVPRTGKWLPEDHLFLETWLDKLVKHVGKNQKPLHPVA